MKLLKKRIIGLDYGQARIGIAITDATQKIAMPYKTLQTEKRLELTVTSLLEELKKHQQEFNYTIDKIILGYPLLLTGKSGLLADEVKIFAEHLKAQIDTEIILWDERLTSKQAERSLREGSLNRKQRSKLVDSVAAVLLLQSYLDALDTNTL